MFSNRSVGTCSSPTVQHLAFTYTPGQFNRTQSCNSLTIGTLRIVSTSYVNTEPKFHTLQQFNTLKHCGEHILSRRADIFISYHFYNKSDYLLKQHCLCKRDEMVSLLEYLKY